MTATVPKYIETRIRASVPTGCHVVRQSTPVVSFGDSRTATVATLGLNPSRLEFLDGNGKLLRGERQRLQTLDSLNLSSLIDAPASAVEAVYDWCVCYFQRNPYKRWFGQFVPILSRLGVSHDSGTACHLDLVQWSTNPTWRKLPKATQERLITDDKEFLWSQLTQENLKVLLLNGSAVINQFQRRFDIRLHSALRLKHGHAPATLFHGSIDSLNIIGWTVNLQSSFGVSKEVRNELSEAVFKLAS